MIEKRNRICQSKFPKKKQFRQAYSQLNLKKTKPKNVRAFKSKFHQQRIVDWKDVFKNLQILLVSSVNNWFHLNLLY